MRKGSKWLSAFLESYCPPLDGERYLTDVLSDYEVCRYIQLENGLYADVYSLEIIIPVAFRLNTYHAHVFRTWLVEKALSKEKRQAYVMFIQNGKAGYC